MKIDIDSVEHTMLNAGIDQTEVNKVIDDLKQQLEELKAQKQNVPKVEKIKYVVANTTNFNGDVKNLPVSMVEAEDSVRWCDVVDEIISAAKQANNEVKKLKKDPIKNVFDAMERVPAKFFKSRKIRIISKEQPQVIETDNQID